MLPSSSRLDRTGVLIRFAFLFYSMHPTCTTLLLFPSFHHPNGVYGTLFRRVVITFSLRALY